MRRIVIVGIFAALGLASILASPALAHEGEADLDCSVASFAGHGFPKSQVTVLHFEVSGSATLSADVEASADEEGKIQGSVPIEASGPTSVRVSWVADNERGHADHDEDMSGCTETTTTAAPTTTAPSTTTSIAATSTTVPPTPPTTAVPPSDQLPRTGGGSALLVGVACVVLGTGLVIHGRWRRTRTH